MSAGFLTYKDVTAMTTLSRQSIWRKFNAGEFPKPIVYGNKTMFVRSEVEAWCDELVTKLRDNPHTAA